MVVDSRLGVTSDGLADYKMMKALPLVLQIGYRKRDLGKKPVQIGLGLEEL